MNDKEQKTKSMGMSGVEDLVKAAYPYADI